MKYPEGATRELKDHILNTRMTRRKGRDEGLHARPRGIDFSVLPLLTLVIMFGFSPNDTPERRRERMKQLLLTLKLLSEVDGVCEVSIPRRDREMFGTLEDDLFRDTPLPDYLQKFQFRLRPDFDSLSEDRAFIEKSFSKSGEVLGVFDSDLLKILKLGVTGHVVRKTVKDPKAFAAMMKEIRRGALAYPRFTIWMFKDRNYACKDNKKADAPQQQYSEHKRAGSPKSRGHYFIVGAKAKPQYAPENEKWNFCEDSFRFLAERKAGGRIGICCWQQTYPVFHRKTGYDENPEWVRNADAVFQIFGYRLKARTIPEKKQDDVDHQEQAVLDTPEVSPACLISNHLVMKSLGTETPLTTSSSPTGLTQNALTR